MQALPFDCLWHGLGRHALRGMCTWHSPIRVCCLANTMCAFGMGCLHSAVCITAAVICVLPCHIKAEHIQDATFPRVPLTQKVASCRGAVVRHRGTLKGRVSTVGISIRLCKSWLVGTADICHKHGVAMRLLPACWLCIHTGHPVSCPVCHISGAWAALA